MDVAIFAQLDTVAQIAATLMGFIAVFLVFSNKRGRFSDADRHFIQAIVLTAAVSVIGGLLPRALAIFGIEDQLWFIALIVATSMAAVVVFLIARGQLRMEPDESATVHWVWHVPGWTLGFAATGLVIAGLVFPEQGPALYVASMTTLTYNALWCFIALVFRRFF